MLNVRTIVMSVAIIAITTLRVQADPPSLGSASSFGVLAGSTVTNTGATVITGNVGVNPGTAITGFPPGTVNAPSTLYPGNAGAAQAEADSVTAYNTLAGEASPPSNNLTGQDLGGLTLTSGVYHYSASSQLTGILTLDGQGDPNSTFIFQIGSALTTASNSSVLFINGADPNDLFWQVGSSATLGTGTAFAGNILALTSITMTTGSSLLDGRALALNGAVTLDTNTISIPIEPSGTPTPEPSQAIVIGFGCLGIGVLLLRARKRRA